MTAIVGLMAGMAVVRFGHDTISITSAEGCVRQLAMAMKLARRQALSEGVPAAVVFSRSDGVVESAVIVRVAGGDTPTESAIAIPAGVTITTANDRWEFDYAGSLSTPLAGGSFTVEAPGWQWSVTVNAATGHVGLARVAN